MSKAMEDSITGEKIRAAARLIKNGKYTCAEIADFTELSIEKVKEIVEQIKLGSE